MQPGDGLSRGPDDKPVFNHRALFVALGFRTERGRGKHQLWLLIDVLTRDGYLDGGTGLNAHRIDGQEARGGEHHELRETAGRASGEGGAQQQGGKNAGGHRTQWLKRNSFVLTSAHTRSS